MLTINYYPFWQVDSLPEIHLPKQARLDATVLSATLQSIDGSWSKSDSFDISQKLLNNDDAFQAADVPVVIAIPKKQEPILLEKLDQVMKNPGFKLYYAGEGPDGATTFYLNAGVEAEDTIFRTYTADATASILHL
jgi:hypothetical protein